MLLDRGELTQNRKKGKGNKLKQTPKKEKNRTQPFVEIRLPTRSGIEILRRSPKVNRARAKIPPQDRQTDKLKQMKEMYLRQNAQN